MRKILLSFSIIILTISFSINLFAQTDVSPVFREMQETINQSILRHYREKTYLTEEWFKYDRHGNKSKIRFHESEIDKLKIKKNELKLKVLESKGELPEWEKGMRVIPPFLHLALRCLELEGGELKARGKKKEKGKEVTKWINRH